MKVHHVNCATMCPVAAGPLLGGHMVCHCLLIETADAGLVLVDTGLGTADVEGETPLTGTFRHLVRPKLDRDETAVERVRDLGFEPEDVRHVILTHLDVDHAGGLPDFPNATVHLHAREKESIGEAPGLIVERRVPDHWAHEPDWHPYEPDGQPWFGFDAVRDLDGLPPEILLIPLAGHTLGHTGVAVDTDDGWLLHAGDAYFSHGEIVDGSCPAALRMFQRILDEDREARFRNQRRLRKLQDRGDIEVFCAHDREEFDRARAPRTPGSPTPDA